MPLSEKGANYEARDALLNPPSSLKEMARHLVRALDDLASQNQAVRSQGNYGQSGPPSAPHPLTSIQVVNQGGFAVATLIHAQAPNGTRYRIQYSTSANFQTPVEIDNGFSLTWENYLHGKTLYFRAAPYFPASPVAPWLYFGSASNPTALTF